MGEKKVWKFQNENLDDFESHSTLKARVELGTCSLWPEEMNRTRDRGNEEENHDYILMNKGNHRL